MERRFAGKVAFVTCGTTGIGQATAVRLASEGALVGVIRPRSKAWCERWRSEVAALTMWFPTQGSTRS